MKGVIKVANVTITDVDEQVKQNFERFCANAGMNMSAAFSALVKIGIHINEQDFLHDSAEKIHRRQVGAVKKFLADVAAIKDEDTTLTDADWDEMANLRLFIKSKVESLQSQK